MKIVAGLGNPGSEYRGSRHNIGWEVVDFLAARHRIRLNQRKYGSLGGKGAINGISVLLVKPRTYMNRSGEALNAIRKDLGLAAGDFIAVFDDIDLPLGKVRKKNKGGDAGHRGVRSIIELLGDDAFYRVRVGIGRPPEGVDTADYVLSRFFDEEKDAVRRAIQSAAEAVEEILMV